jgi:hypothetical protein
MPWFGGALAGAGSVLGGLFGSNAASSASNAQVRASEEAIRAQQQVQQQIQGQLDPFRQTGANAIQNLGTLPMECRLARLEPWAAIPALMHLLSGVDSRCPPSGYAIRVRRLCGCIGSD